MNYLKEIKKLEPIQKFGGRTNDVSMYNLCGEKVVLIERKDVDLEEHHPYERISVPRRIGLSKENIYWMNFSQQLEHSQELRNEGLNIAEFLEVGKNYVVREFKNLKTLKEKIANEEYFPLRKWLEGISIAREKNIPLTDRITWNCFIDRNMNPIYFDFDLGSSDNEYSLAQAIFYSTWLSPNPEKAFEILKEPIEKNIKGKFDGEKLIKFIGNYNERITNPSHPETFLYKIECPPNINTNEEREEHSEKIKETLQEIKLLK